MNGAATFSGSRASTSDLHRSMTPRRTASCPAVPERLARDTGARAVCISDGGITGPAFHDHVRRSRRPVLNCPKAQTTPSPPDPVARPVVGPKVYRTWSLVWRRSEARAAVLSTVEALTDGVRRPRPERPGRVAARRRPARAVTRLQRTGADRPSRNTSKDHRGTAVRCTSPPVRQPDPTAEPRAPKAGWRSRPPLAHWARAQSALTPTGSAPVNRTRSLQVVRKTVCASPAPAQTYG
ncbi:hypothetical protein GCM10010358_71970 [Streptomyces minutiscleroticus]|uniref:Uncharacterized protein n=1 Tax=Streptomyces minutiscleroticus TaxID=68238 RepID=A0A918U8C9_9ACTN|nr:hypothetical protein GCM10010358_71970 [Streptomyces minutiscleroticus]